MANVMGILLRVVDAWQDLSRAGDEPDELRDDDERLEVLGHLVRLVARRFHGFREVPNTEDVSLALSGGKLELTIRSPRRVPLETEVVERHLSRYGFHLERSADNRTLVLGCTAEPAAKVLAFPAAPAAVQRRRKR
jgi:hypothetical protein